MYFKRLVILLLLLNFFSCKKDQIDYLKKGKWALEWSAGTYMLHKGTLHFKSHGKGIFEEAITNTKYPFNYTINGKSASYKWENPTFSNSSQAFNIVLENSTIQVWEEKNKESTFVIKKI